MRIQRENLKKINQPQAKSSGFETITHPALLHLLVDAGVHSGPKRAVQWLQSALGVTTVGVIGIWWPTHVFQAVENLNKLLGAVPGSLWWLFGAGYPCYTGARTHCLYGYRGRGIFTFVGVNGCFIGCFD